MSTATETTVAWPCDTCGLEIGDGEGWLLVDVSAAAASIRARCEWARDHGSVVSIAELLALPEGASWLAYHGPCDPKPEAGGEYWIGIERIRSTGDVLRWTAHLMGKNWLPGTDWSSLLCRVADRCGAREP